MEEDVFEASESSDSDLEISEGLHRDFEKSSRWGKSLQMLKKMKSLMTEALSLLKSKHHILKSQIQCLFQSSEIVEGSE